MNEFLSEPLLVHEAQRPNANDAATVVTELFPQHGEPRHLRSDNGPEFIAKRFREQMKEHRVKTLYIALSSLNLIRMRGSLRA